jgi:hypothetical protein
MKDGAPVGFLFAYPIYLPLSSAHGVSSFGWIDLWLKWVIKMGQHQVPLAQVYAGARRSVGEEKSIVEGGFEEAEIVQMGVENERMQRELRDLGIDFYKTHRIYQLLL